MEVSTPFLNRHLAFVVMVLGLLQFGCTSSMPRVMEFESTDVERVWPQPPDVPRYRFVGVLTGENNFPADKDRTTAVGRALEFLVGAFSAGRELRVLQRPQTGVADNEGRLYITDVSRQAVFVFDRPKGELLIWDRATEFQRFKSPIGIALTPAGEILVADAEIGRVIRLDRNGQPLGDFGQESFSRPTGVAVDPLTGRVYVSDTQAHHIKVFEATGGLVDTIGMRGEEEGQFNFPTHLSFSGDRLYVTDRMNARIQVFDRDGRVLLAFGRRGRSIGDLPHVKGVAADEDGNIYAVESFFDHLVIYNDNGQLLMAIGGTGKEIGQFFLPAGVWTDKNNYIYIADMFNGRIVVLQYLE